MLRSAARYRAGLLWGIACVACANVVQLAQPQVLRYAIDDLYAGVTAEKLGRYALMVLGIAEPALDALAASGVRFDQVQTAVPLTGPSHATILTGQYPPAHGVRGNVVFSLGSKYPTLATG